MKDESLRVDKVADSMEKKKMKKEIKDREEGKLLTRVKVLKKFMEIFGLKVLKTPPLSPEGETVWSLVKELDGVVYPLYSSTGFEICALGPRTDILYLLFNVIPWWTERDGCSFLERQVANPLFGCKSLEEAWLKLDLLQEDGNRF